ARYLTVDGKPLFAIFQPDDLPDAKRVTDSWRELALKSGLPGLHLVGLTEDPQWVPAEHGFDAAALSLLSSTRALPGRGVYRLRRGLHHRRASAWLMSRLDKWYIRV